MIAALAKAVLPQSTLQRIARFRARLRGREIAYRGKENSEIFDDIYANGLWGLDETGTAFSGSGSHRPDIIEPYIDVVRHVLETHEISTAVDLGCGDFNVGKAIASLCEKYIACDVSSVIVERNKQSFALDNVEFRQLDMSKDDLPTGDIAFVRQVLQHLSNADIESFVRKVQTQKSYKYLLVTEHLPAGDDFQPNLDKPSGKTTRINKGSGVDLAEPPFNLQYKSKNVVLETAQDTEGFKAIIRCTLYKFKAAGDSDQ